MGNLYKDKLSGSRIGIVFGAFAPCHIGHLEVILKAKKENDGCVVIVCGEDGDCGEPFGLDVYRRFRYMRELFADDNQIYVVMAAGQGIPQKETEWESWLEIINLKIADSLQHSDAQKIY